MDLRKSRQPSVGSNSLQDDRQNQGHMKQPTIQSIPQEIGTKNVQNKASKVKIKEVMSKKIKNWESPSLQQLIFTHPNHFSKKSINIFFTKQVQLSSASNLWEVMINPDDPSTLLFRHLLFDITLKPLKPVFINMHNRHCSSGQQQRQLIVKFHMQNQSDKFLHVLANKYDPVDHKFVYTKFGILQKEDMSGLSDLFSLQPPLNAGTALGVKFVQMCSSYLYKNKSFVPYTKQLDKLYDILSKIKLFTQNSLPQYFDDSINYGTISYRHQSLIRESLILQRLFEILTQIVEYDQDRFKLSLSSFDQDDKLSQDSNWTENAANSPTIPPDQIITLILDICILNITSHKENTKYVLIYLFPKHLLREKVFMPFSSSIMRLAQQIAMNIKPILGSVDGSLKIILKQLIFYMISDWKKVKSPDKQQKKEIITTLRVFFKTLKDYGLKDLVRHVYSLLTTCGGAYGPGYDILSNSYNSNPSLVHDDNNSPTNIPRSQSRLEEQYNLQTQQSKQGTGGQTFDILHQNPNRPQQQQQQRQIMFQGSILIPDPDYIIPLLHQQLTAVDFQLECDSNQFRYEGSASALNNFQATNQNIKFNPQYLIEIISRMDRDLVKRQLYLYANICQCSRFPFSQIQTHRICTLIRQWQFYVEYSQVKQCITDQDYLIKAGLLRLLYTLLILTDRSIISNPKYVRYFADQIKEDVSSKCERIVLNTDFSKFNGEAARNQMQKRQEMTANDQMHSLGNIQMAIPKEEIKKIKKKSRFMKMKSKISMARQKSVEQGKPLIGSVLLSPQDIQTLFEVERLDFADNLDPYSLRQSHVEFMKIINYFVSAGILQHQDDIIIAKRALGLVLSAFHKYIQVCTQAQNQFQEKYSKNILSAANDQNQSEFKQNTVEQIQDVPGLQDQGNDLEPSNSPDMKLKNSAKGFPKITTLDLHILELEVKLKKQQILESAMNKKMNHEHPTLFRYFDILHTYLGLVNSCLSIKMMKKNSAKKQASAKK